MVRIVRVRGAIEMMDPVRAPIMLIGELGSQTINIAATTFQREVPQHLIKRAVLEQQHDDMLDLPEVGDTALVSHNG